VVFFLKGVVFVSGKYSLEEEQRVGGLEYPQAKEKHDNKT